MHGGGSRRHTDDGFTLIELTVALTILAVGIVAVVGVMMSSFKVAGASRSRSRAVAVTTQEIEALRSRPYGQLIVTGVATTRDVTVGGGTYHVQQGVSWAGYGTTTNDPKTVTVQVTWTDETGSHEVHQSSVIYPGGLGPRVTTVTTAPAAGGNPAAPSALVVAAVPGISGADLAWTPPVSSSPLPDSYVVRYSTDSSFATYQAVTAAVPAVTPLVRVADLAPATTYYFRVYSKAANGNLSATWASGSVTTPTSASPTCALGTATVTPSAVTKKSSSAGSGLTTDPLVNVSVIGACSSTVLRMVYSPLGNSVTESVTLSGAGPVRTGQVGNSSQTWTVGDHEINVLDASNATRATMRLIVCDHSKLVCP